MRVSSERQRYRLPRLGAAVLLLFATASGCGARDEGPTARSEGTPVGVAPAAAVRPAHERPVVLFLGDSLTAGYGLTAEEAYPALIQQRIDAGDLGFRVVNAGVSGDTSAGGRRRIAWLLRQPVAVLVLALGGNDMLRGQDLVALRDNLRSIIAQTRARHPDAHTVIAGMRAPANLGRAYGTGFEATFPALARETDSALIPFLLDGVAAEPELNQRDGIHPTAEGQRRIADTVWTTLEPILLRRRLPRTQRRSGVAAHVGVLLGGRKTFDSSKLGIWHTGILDAPAATCWRALAGWIPFFRRGW